MKVPSLHQATAGFKRWLAKPRDQMGRWQRIARFLVDLGRHCYDEMMADRALEMAAALTYRTIFGLIPLFVVALLVFRAFGGFASYGPQLQDQLYSFLNLNFSTHQKAQPSANHTGQSGGQSVQNVKASGSANASSQSPPQSSSASEQSGSAGGGGFTPSQAGGAEGSSSGGGGGAGQSASAHAGKGESKSQKKADQADIEQILNQLNKRVQNVSFTSIGLVGLVLLLWAAIALVVNVEQCFNWVFQSTTGRSWVKRITTYWAVITLGPVMLVLSLYLSGVLVDTIQQFAHTGMGGGGGAASGGASTVPSSVWAYLMGALLWVLAIIIRLASVVVTVVLLFLLYMLLPNTHVRARPALIGAAVAGVLWEIAKFCFGLYVSRAVTISALYGSLGLIPLFLLWLYLTWVIVILGLELTYTLQAMRHGRFQRLRASHDAATDMDPRWLIALMAVVAKAFDQGRTISDGDIAGALGLPIVSVQALAKRLEKAGLLHEIEDRAATMEGSEWSLACPADRVPLTRLLQVGEELANRRRSRAELPAADVLRMMKEAQQQAVGERTLEATLPSEPAQ